MPRWYALFRKPGKPDRIRNDVEQLVKNYNAQEIVTRISFEKRAKWGGELYFALGIESESPGHIPHRIADWFEMPLLGQATRIDIDNPRSAIKAFARDELMWMGEATIADYARVLRYSRNKELVPDDPFAVPTEDFLDDQESDHLDGHLERAQQYDQLLTWLSVMGSGSLAQLRAATIALGLSTPTDGSSHLLRRLRLLGHLETSPDGKRWSVAPTALVESGDAAGCFFLAGARDQRLMTSLRNYGEVEHRPMERGDAPSHAQLRPGDPRMIDYMPSLREIAAGRAAERIAGVLPDIDAWHRTLQRVPVHPEMYDLRHHDGNGFRDVAMLKDDGLYEFYERGALDGPTKGDPAFSLYHDAKHGEWYRGDWYGLRFLADVRREQSVTACYDLAARQLAVFRDQRWPELYERAAVLASGRLPQVDGPWLLYDGISPELVAALAERLHLDIDTTGGLRDA